MSVKQRKMTRDEMIARLDRLVVGTRIRLSDNKIYKVLGFAQFNAKLHRRDMNILEEGLPETYEVEGKYLAAGRVLTFSNIKHVSWLAIPSDMARFEILSDEQSSEKKEEIA